MYEFPLSENLDVDPVFHNITGGNINQFLYLYFIKIIPFWQRNNILKSFIHHGAAFRTAAYTYVTRTVPSTNEFHAVSYVYSSRKLKKSQVNAQ